MIIPGSPGQCTLGEAYCRLTLTASTVRDIEQVDQHLNRNLEKQPDLIPDWAGPGVGGWGGYGRVG